MEVYLPTGDRLRGDLLVRAVLRSDLAPVPMTLECAVRHTAELEKLLIEDARVRAGPGLPEFRIAWVAPERGGNEQGGRGLGVIRFIALLDACAEVAFARKTAVVKEGATLGAIYRACGARVQIDSDFAVERFSCLVGGTPTFHISQALQEQAGTLVWIGAGRLRFVRLPDLFGAPVERLSGSGVERVRSGFMERHTVPWFYTTAPDGKVIHGNRAKARSSAFTPLKSLPVLHNLSRTLMHCATFTGRYNASVLAGQCVEVDGLGSLAVVTALHAIDRGDDGAQADTYSRFWLARLEA